MTETEEKIIEAFIKSQQLYGYALKACVRAKNLMDQAALKVPKKYKTSNE